jgi:hypothetical protein
MSTRPRSFTSSFRGRGGAKFGLTRRRRWAIVVAAVVALYWVGLVRMGAWSPSSPSAAPERVRGVERAPVVEGINLEGVEDEREMAEQREEAEAEGEARAFGQEAVATTAANLRRDAQPNVVKQRLEEAVAAVEAGTLATPADDEQRSDAASSWRMRAATPIVATAPVAHADSDTPTSETPAVELEHRHVTLSGYQETLQFLESYRTPAGSDEELFLFFVCSDEQGREYDWRRMCADAKTKVYDVFANSPASKRLVTVYAGTKKDWTTKNPFFDDADLRVKAVPSIMKWRGGAPGAKRATYGMMIEETVLYEPLLRYLFGNTDVVDPLLAPEDVATKEIVTLQGYAEYSVYMDRYNADPAAEPMFLMLISGRMPGNDRLWCPYCRYVELSVEYAFYAYAPRGARLVRVETFPSYGQWKKKDNDFKRDETLNVRGVPAFYRIYPSEGTQQTRYQRVVESFNLLEPLQRAFQGSG